MSNEKGKTPAPAPPRCNFVELVDAIGHGSLRTKLENQLGELTQAVRETGKVGKLALTVTVKPDGEFAGVSADVKMTKPTHSVPPSVFFWDDDAGLSRSNPRQLAMRELDDEPTERKPMRDTGGDAGPMRVV